MSFRGRRGRGSSRSGGAFRRKNFSVRSNPYGAKRDPMEIENEEEEFWPHDKFQDNFEGNNKTNSQQRFGRSRELPRETDNCLHVSNLEYTVLEDDLEKLFGTVGKIVKVSVYYDRSGRSKGVADITFASGSDAQAAKKKFNGMDFHGKVMEISFARRKPVRRTTGNRRYVNPFNRNRAGPRRNFNSSRRDMRNRPRRPSQKSSKPTAEELDAELDEYSSMRD